VENYFIRGRRALEIECLHRTLRGGNGKEENCERSGPAWDKLVCWPIVVWIMINGSERSTRRFLEIGGTRFRLKAVVEKVREETSKTELNM